ncbi:MAG: metal ABC transporter substrate-binding protein [Lachnospiraceae bacterium]|nr:metal ABC transporter substrate-binding protein [Lachnospiraceae bacterium]
MRKSIAVLTIVLMLAGLLTACSGGTAKSGKKQIVATVFPEYDWVMNVLGDKAGDYDVTMLLDNGVDLHSFQATAADIMKISSCDMLIYVGGESDEWIEDAVKEAVNKDMVVINLLETLGDAVKEEEIVEGMEGEDHEEGEDHDDDHGHGHDHEGDEVEYDEHVWLSLRNAEVIVNAIADAFAGIDSENASVYSSNAAVYNEKLKALDAGYKAAVDGASAKTVLFGDRFPFRYLTDDYGLSYYAAFVGCSAETEASFETVVFLANKLDELGLKAVLTIETSDQKLAKTIKENSKSADQEILMLDSMQSTTSKDIKAGATYLSIMEKNLEVLKKALR